MKKALPAFKRIESELAQIEKEVEAAVASGTLTKARRDEMQQRINRLRESNDAVVDASRRVALMTRPWMPSWTGTLKTKKAGGTSTDTQAVEHRTGRLAAVRGSSERTRPSHPDGLIDMSRFSGTLGRIICPGFLER
jgi:hypothetical protein